MKWKYKKNEFFFSKDRKLKVIFKEADLTEREFFADIGESLLHNIYWLVIFCSNSSPFPEKWAKNIGITVKVIPASNIPITLSNLDHFFSDLFDKKPKKSVLREAFMYELLNQEIKHSDTMIKQILEELDLYTVSDLLMYAIQSRSILSSEGTKQKTGITFDRVFGALFASFINPDCASIGGSGNPDVITVFNYPSIDKKSDLMYISLKTSKDELFVSKRDVDEVCGHLRTLLQAESTNLRHYSISHLIFVKPSFRNEKNLLTFSQEIRERIGRDIQIHYIASQVIAQYILQLRKALADSYIITTLDFLNFLKKVNNHLIKEIKTVDIFFDNLKKSRKSHLKDEIRSVMKK